MLALKLMAIFAVAYAQMACGVAALQRKNHGEVFAFDLKMKMVKASSSGGIDKIPEERVNSGSDEGETQESATVKTAASEIPSPTLRTTTEVETTPTSTEAEVTTVELETVTLPAACPAEYEAFWVSDYSEAEKRFLKRFNESNLEDCSKKIEPDDLEKWIELSFSLEDGVCTLYTYAPVNRSDIGPPPKKDGNDKILYVKETPTDLCTAEFEGETFQWPYNTYMLLPSSHQFECVLFTCSSEGHTSMRNGDLYNFGDDKCLGTYSSALINYEYGDALFNIFFDFDEQTFVSYNWSRLRELEEADPWKGSQFADTHILVDAMYDSAVDEYRWRQSLRPIPDNSSLWAPGYPTDERHPCVAVYPDSLRDVLCPETDVISYHLYYSYFFVV